jgi:hypothetical protein
MSFTYDNEFGLVSGGTPNWDGSVNANFSVMERGHHVKAVAGTSVPSGHVVTMVNSGHMLLYNPASEGVQPYAIAPSDVASGALGSFLRQGIVRSVEVWSAFLTPGNPVYVSTASPGFVVGSYAGANKQVGLAIAQTGIIFSPVLVGSSAAAAGAAGAAIRDEGVSINSAPLFMDFVGPNVAVTATGSGVTVTVSGAAGGGSSGGSGGGNGPFAITRLTRVATMAITNTSYHIISADSALIDTASAWLTNSPALVQVPSGYIWVRATNFYRAGAAATGRKDVTFNATRAGSTVALAIDQYNAAGEGGHNTVWPWIKVQSGDALFMSYLSVGATQNLIYWDQQYEWAVDSSFVPAAGSSSGGGGYPTAVVKLSFTNPQTLTSAWTVASFNVALINDFGIWNSSSASILTVPNSGFNKVGLTAYSVVESANDFIGSIRKNSGGNVNSGEYIANYGPYQQYFGNAFHSAGEVIIDVVSGDTIQFFNFTGNNRRLLGTSSHAWLVSGGATFLQARFFNSGSASLAGGSSGSSRLVETWTASGGETSKMFSTLGSGNNLTLFASGRISDMTRDVYLYCNSDTTAGNYRSYKRALTSPGNYSGAVRIYAGEASTASSPSAFSADATLYDYCNSTYHKRALAHYAFEYASGSVEMAEVSGAWRNVAPITSLLVSVSTGTFAPGTTLTLYRD